MNIRKIIYNFVANHPLCDTEDIARHINRTKEHTAKICYQLEERDSLRCPVKINNRNHWIIGENDYFLNITNPRTQFYRGGNTLGGGGDGTVINRKRIATVTVTANDAKALFRAGATKLFVQ